MAFTSIAEARKWLERKGVNLVNNGTFQNGVWRVTLKGDAGDKRTLEIVIDPNGSNNGVGAEGDGSQNGKDGDNGPGTGGGDGGGGGGSNEMTWKEFQRMARVVYYQLGIDYNEQIARRAFNYKKAKIDNSGDFLTFVRRYDRSYVNSRNYEERAWALLKTYKMYDPNTTKTLKDMRKLVANGYTSNTLQYKIEHSDWYKKAYKYLKYNPDLSLQQYRAQSSSIKDILNRTYGYDKSNRKDLDLDMRAIFSRKLTDAEVRMRVNQMISGGTALEWQDRANPKAGFNRQEQRAYISKAPNSQPLESQLTTAQRNMASYVGSKGTQVSTEREKDLSKIVKRI